VKRPVVFGSLKPGSSSCGITATSIKARTVQNSVDFSPLLSARLRDKTPDVSTRDAGYGKLQSAKVHIDYDCSEKEEREMREERKEKDLDVESGKRFRGGSFTACGGGGGGGVSQRIADSPMGPHCESTHSKPEEEEEGDDALYPSPIHQSNSTTNDNSCKI
jgi:hypothetical protein